MWFRHIFSTANRVRSGNALQPNNSCELRVTTQALNQLNRLRLNASRYLPGQGAGSRASIRRKPAVDFREHRMYVPGDDMRFVDWKASARQEHIFIKQGEYQKKINVYILLDCSASMGWGDPPKSSTAISLAASLGYSALSHGDRLMVVPLGVPTHNDNTRAKLPPPLGPISGKGQFPGLLNYLRAIPFQGTVQFSEAIHYFIGQIASGSGLVLFISDLLSVSPYGDNDLSDALKYLPMPTWNVFVFHVLHPEELRPTLHGEFEFLDIETGTTSNYDITSKALLIYQDRIQKWRERIEFDCIENNSLYTLIPSDMSLDTDIIPLLRELNVVIPA